MGVKRRLVGAVLVGGALVLGGCGGASPAPEPTPSVTAEPSAPESPTPTPSRGASALAKPERPADMDRTDEVGAAAAAEYFLELYPYMMRSGDFTEWDRFSWDGCDYCAGSRATAVDFRDGGFLLVDANVEVRVVTVQPIDAELNIYPVDLITHQFPGLILDASSFQVGTVDEATIDTRVDIRLDGRQWKIIAVTDASKSA